MSAKKKPIRCPDCGKAFWTLADLQRHAKQTGHDLSELEKQIQAKVKKSLKQVVERVQQILASYD